MERKILKIGPATLAVSLPTNWVKRFGLKKGQELIVEEQESALRVGVKKAASEENAAINVSQMHPFSTKLIGMLYKVGFKKIKAYYEPNRVIQHRGKSIKELDMIRNTFDHLIGMQFWDLGYENQGYYAVAVESAEINSRGFDNAFNKLYLNIIHQAEQVYDWFAKDIDIYDEVYLTERLINQNSDLCAKILISSGHIDSKKTLYYYDFVNRLESIGDRYFKIGMYFKAKKTLDNNTKEFLRKSLQFIKDSHSLHSSFDFKKAVTLTLKITDMVEECESGIAMRAAKRELVSYQIYSILVEILEVVEKLYFLHYDYFKEK